MNAIEKSIRTRLDTIFSNYQPNDQLTEFKEELVADLMDVYQDFTKSDRSHEEALDDAFAQLGDIDSVLRDMSNTNNQFDYKKQTDESTSNNNKKNFFEFSDNGVHLGNLHIDGDGIRLGDDIVIDGKNNHVKLGDWLHLDKSGARFGSNYYKFDKSSHYHDDDFKETTPNAPTWAVAHHNIQLPISDKKITFNYANATLNFYTNDKSDLITLDEYFSRDNQRYFANITETDSEVTISKGDNPLIFHVRTMVNIGLPKYYPKSHISVINRSGQITAHDLNLDQFDLYMNSGSFKGSNITAKQAIWSLDSGKLSAKNIDSNGLNISNNFGKVLLDNTTSKHAQITVQSGIIDANNFNGGGNFSATSGEIRLRINSLTSNLKIKANTSSIRVTKPGLQSFYFDLLANTGLVSLTESSNTHFDKNTSSYKRGFYGDNPEYTIDASVESGTIKIY